MPDKAAPPAWCKLSKMEPQCLSRTMILSRRLLMFSMDDVAAKILEVHLLTLTLARLRLHPSSACVASSFRNFHFETPAALKIREWQFSSQRKLHKQIMHDAKMPSTIGASMQWAATSLPNCRLPRVPFHPAAQPLHFVFLMLRQNVEIAVSYRHTTTCKVESTLTCDDQSSSSVSYLGNSPKLEMR